MRPPKEEDNPTLKGEVTLMPPLNGVKQNGKPKPFTCG